MIQRKYKILYFEGSPDLGGSTVSLYNLVQGLDKDLLEPIVVLDPLNLMLISSFQKSNIRVILFGTDHRNAQSPLTMLDYFKKKGWFNQYSKYKEYFPTTYKFFRFFLNKLSSVYKCIFYHKRILIPLLSKALKIRQVIIQNNIDLIHTNNSLSANQSAFIAAKLARKPCICHIRGYEAQSYGLNRLLSLFVDRFIFNSKATKNVYPYRIARLNKGNVIYNGLDFDSFNYKFNIDSIRNEFGFKQNSFLVGMIGRLKEWKGQKIFLQAMAIVTRELSNIKGLIVGGEDPDSPGYRKELVSLDSVLGLEDKVIFAGWRQDIARLISDCDVLVHCSIKPEPFGLVIIEAMAAGKPVIASNAGGVPEIITDGVDGVLVTPGDAKALANAIMSIYSDNTKAEEMGVRARETVMKRFNVNRYVNQVEDVYKKVLRIT